MEMTKANFIKLLDSIPVDKFEVTINLTYDQEERGWQSPENKPIKMSVQDTQSITVEAEWSKYQTRE